jgi:histidinol-phosphate/aromatic aminotransferase/cobyric acid decarboxylase-like protein
VLVTNGGSEAIHLVASLIGGRVAAEPEFSLHPRHRTGPSWRIDPHSPSGRRAAPDERAEVWDEAFYPLATGRWTAGRPGVVVGSLTKTFACPGLRLGYVIADEATIAALAARQAQWSVGTLALAVLPDLLDAADLTTWSRRIAELRSEMVTALRDRGLDVQAADAPWVLVRGAGLRDRLARQRVLVRDCASFGLADHARIAVPDEDGLERLLGALDVALPEGAGVLAGHRSPATEAS